MRRSISLAVVFTLIATYSFAQHDADTLVIREKMGQNMFYLKDEKVTHRQLKELLSRNQEAIDAYKLSRKYYWFSAVSGGVAGFFLGTTLGGAISSNKIELIPMGLGFGFFALNIPFIKQYNRHSSNAIKLYNAGLFTKRAENDTPELIDE